jgi:7-cyano-7-deazaguanine synthase
MSRPRAVVLLSGGMDSCVCAALAVRDYEPALLHFDYGQRTAAREREAFVAMADHFGINRRLVVKTDFFHQIGGSALTDTRLAVPESGVEADTIPITYVPFRNAHLLAAAVSWAEVLEADRVVIGAVAPDSSGYPD